MRQATSCLTTALLCVGAYACGGDLVTPPVETEEPDPVVSSIELRPPDRTIGVLGTSFQIRALALAADGEMLYGSYLDPDRFAWSSSAPDVATVSEVTHPITGRSVRLVTGMGEGTATITGTSQGFSGSTRVTVRDAARVAWSVPLGTGAIQAGIAIGVDGTSYVVSYQYGSASRVFALSPHGGIVWTLDIPFRVTSTPAIGDDGTLYFAAWSTDSSTGSLIAVDPGGSIRWRLDVDDRIRSSPALGADGTIYVAGGHHVYAVDPRGEIWWTFGPNEEVFLASSPGIARDGTIYVGNEDHFLYAIDPDGSLRWTFETNDRIRSSPSIGPDGTIYFGSYDGRLYAVHPDGTERWSVALHCGLPWGCVPIQSSPSIGPDGTIYVGADGVYAVDPEGSVLWNYEPCCTVLTTPLLGADGTVYIGSAAVDAQGRLLWDSGIGGHMMGSPAIGVDGTILSTSFSGSSSDAFQGTIQATVETEPTNGGFAGAPWPTVRGNRANNGRAGG